MPKFELFVNELVNHQHRVVVEVNSEDEVEEALDYADNCHEDSASDYICRIKERITVLGRDNDYCVEVKEVECDDINELDEDEEEESEED